MWAAAALRVTCGTGARCSLAEGALGLGDDMAALLLADKHIQHRKNGSLISIRNTRPVQESNAAGVRSRDRSGHLQAVGSAAYASMSLHCTSGNTTAGCCCSAPHLNAIMRRVQSRSGGKPLRTMASQLNFRATCQSVKRLLLAQARLVAPAHWRGCFRRRRLPLQYRCRTFARQAATEPSTFFQRQRLQQQRVTRAWPPRGTRK